MRLALAQYRELAAFSQFASDLDEATRKQLERGQRITEVLKQKQYSPESVGEMVIVLFAADQGFLDDIELKNILSFEDALLSYMHSDQKEFMAKLNTGDYNDEIAKQLRSVIDTFKKTNTW